MSQSKGIILDIQTRQPIPYVNIYTKNGENVLGAVSNEEGKFDVQFPFHSLFFSHLNYSKIEINKENLSDTICMIPTSIELNGVEISSKQPEWIYRILKEVLKQKAKNYQTILQQLSFDYETYTLSDSNGYAFKSKGNILIPVLSKEALYQIDAQQNTIRYKDKTAGCDFSNLKRMLYGDFIKNFNTAFIKDYNFSQNSSYESKNPNMVQLVFSSKKYKDDEGYIIIDTLNHVIVESEHNSGTDYNIKTQTPMVLRNAAAARGFRYNQWITQVHYSYTKTGNCYQISDSKYKFVMKSSMKKDDIVSQYFTSIESKLILKSNLNGESKKMNILPPPFYIVKILTKQMQKEEETLNKVQVSFDTF